MDKEFAFLGSVMVTLGSLGQYLRARLVDKKEIKWELSQLDIRRNGIEEDRYKDFRRALWGARLDEGCWVCLSVGAAAVMVAACMAL